MMAEPTNEPGIRFGQGVNSSLLVDAGSKSPSKSRKPRKVSLFKKSAHDEASAIKIIGVRGKRRSSREKQIDSMEAGEVEPQQNALEIGTSSPVHQRQPSDEAESRHYEIQTQEQEQKSTGDLSVKLFHKLNRQLAKERKSVDALKREREVLVSEKVKLKTENRTLERELKRTGLKSDPHRMSKKQSQLLSMEESVLNLEEMRLKVIELEDRLAEKDHKITVLKLTHSNANDGIDIGIHTASDGILDSTATLERLLEEQDNSLKLRKENADLRACILTMDSELEKVHRESNPSLRSPRKRSSAFFKRGKKNTSSMPSRYVSVDGPFENVQGQKRSESPVMGKAESHQALDISASPLLSRANKVSTISLPCYGSPNHSPQTPKTNKTDSDLETLQACLKLALNEKSVFEENVAYLQKELDGARGKMQELERALEVKTNKEMEKIQKSLTAAEIDRDTYFDELKICQQEVDEMTEKFNMLETSYTAARDKIKELEEELEALRYSGFSSLSRSSSNISSLKMPTPVTSPKDKVVSSPKDKVVNSTQKFKYSTSPTHQPVKPVIEPKTVALESTSTSSTSNIQKPNKVRSLSRDLSLEKPILRPPSPVKKVGRLSRESNIDQFETHKENVTNNKVSGIPPPSPSHGFAKVAATRAMFEQKIDQTKISYAHHTRHSSRTIESEEPRRCFSMVVNSTSLTENRPRTVMVLPKSNSCDQSAKPSSLLKSPGTSVEKLPEVGVVRLDKSKSVPPSNVRNACNGGSAADNEARNKINTTHKQQLEKMPNSNSVCVLRTSSPTNKAPNSMHAASPTKVSKITFTSTATSTSLPISKDPSLKLARRESSPSALLLKSSPHTTVSPTSSHARILQRAPENVTTTTVRRVTVSSSNLEETSMTSDKMTHSAVTKSPTKIKVHPQVRSWNSVFERQSSRIASNSSTVTTSTTAASRTSIASPTSTSTPFSSSSSTSRSIPKLQDKKLVSPITKVGSLQNIQSYISSANSVTPPTQTPPQSAANVTVPSMLPSVSGIRRGPTHRALQRRERKDRPKTMFAGSPESSNLVNLISKFQQEESDKKLKDVRASTGSGLSSIGSKPSMNGTVPSSSFVSTPINSVPPAVSSSTSNINLRLTGNKPRPLTFYGGDSSTSSNRNLTDSNNNLSNKKPVHAKLRRAQTVGVVGGGLGNNRMSKKAMLLKWCQIMTQNYENVKIDNFGESFSNGLAFCALMHHFLPDEIAFSTLNSVNREKNFKVAFEAAEGVGIPSLLDVEDMVSLPIPDWMSVMTYVSFIYNRFGQEKQQQKNSII